MKPYEPESLPLDCIDWAAHVSLIGQANAALARYDGMVQSIVNPLVLLSPLTTQEAVLSSRIEGTQANMEEVLEYEAAPEKPVEPTKYDDIQEIINYRRAMGQSVESLKKRPLCLNLVKELHATLLESARGRNKAPGQFRKIQNYIAPPGRPMEEADFVPPSPEKLPAALDNWEKYLHLEEKDVLVQLAIAKAQFEIIHPFLDGNGRLGRMLIPLFLYAKGLLSEPTFYVSAYLEEHRDIYYERLRAISKEKDWNGWITFFLTAVNEQAKQNTQTVRAVMDLYERLKGVIVDLTHSQYALQTLDAIFSRPIFRSTQFQAQAGIPTRPTAGLVLRKLEEGGILKVFEKGSGRRPALIVFSDLINLVEGKAVV
ncbi:MAG TPA: Fic/DOC family N-terminal domain-containing protein [bacterium]|nr:Fic/DOC family N-terminal domain-containing protein [bacterium]HQL61957.1 Fic/DOC family N-terminal domain-containing protein [bacterium]